MGLSLSLLSTTKYLTVSIVGASASRIAKGKSSTKPLTFLVVAAAPLYARAHILKVARDEVRPAHDPLIAAC